MKVLIIYEEKQTTGQFTKTIHHTLESCRSVELTEDDGFSAPSVIVRDYAKNPILSLDPHKIFKIEIIP